MKKENKKRKLNIKSIIVLISIILIISISLIFLFNTNFKLKRIGYSKEEITVLRDKLDNNELDIILNNEYLKDLTNLINNAEYDKKNLNNYIIELKEGKSVNDVILDFNPTILNLKKEKYYIDSYKERYLAYSLKYSDKDMAEVIKCVNSGIDNEFYTNMQSTDLSKGHLILVNKFNTLDKSYSPKLVSVAKYGWGYLEEETAKAYIEMYNAAKKDNMKLLIVSPYRSYDTQKNLYNNYVKRDGVAKADTYSARPGSSEHQTGMGVDINTSSSADNFESSNEYKWLLNNSYKYGFIIRYPKGSEYITGYKFEPWHYRYVGIDAATKIHDENITFEEYYAYYVLNNN